MRIGLALALPVFFTLLACAESELADTRERDAEAARRYLQAGVNGAPADKLNLALMYLMGRGVPQDYNESLRWMLEAAVAAHPAASAKLSCLRTGRAGVKLGPKPRKFEDLPTDTPELKRDAGLYYWQRSCDPADSAKAVELLAEAANADLPNAQYMLGIAYRQGRGVSRDYRESAKWFRRASGQGHMAARRAFCELRDAAQVGRSGIESRTKEWCGTN